MLNMWMTQRITTGWAKQSGFFHFFTIKIPWLLLLTFMESKFTGLETPLTVLKWLMYQKRPIMIVIIVTMFNVERFYNCEKDILLFLYDKIKHSHKIL